MPVDGQWGAVVAARYEFTVTSSNDGVSDARRKLASWLELHGEDLQGWMLIATELITNAIAVADSPVHVEIEMDGDEVILTVTDDGPGFRLGTAEMPGPEAPRGRGLAIVAKLTSSLSATRVGDRTLMRCSRTAARARP